MGVFIDLTGRRFGRLVAQERQGLKGDDRLWRCTCDCGQEVVVRGSLLRGGRTLSCGCLVREIAARSRAFGCTLNGKQTPEYRSYRAMLARCYDSTHPHYDQYGGRGITVCGRWRDGFVFFRDDMGARPLGTTLDRIMPDGNYEPANCRWATVAQQARNKRTTKWVTIRGVTLTISDWKRALGLSSDSLSARALEVVAQFLDSHPQLTGEEVAGLLDVAPSDIPNTEAA